MNSSENDRHAQTVCLVILCAIASGAALYWLAPVLVPFVLAIFLTYCLTPVIDLQIRRWRMPRMIAVLSTVLLGCVLLVAFGTVISITVGQMASRAGEYEDRIIELIDVLSERGLSLLNRVGVDPASVAVSNIDIPKEALGGILSKTISGIMNVVSNGLLVFIFMVFMLMGRTARQQQGLLGEVEVKINRYIITMVFTSATTGLLVGLTLAIIGVEFAWAFGFLAFLLNFIPNIGSVIATLLPLPVALLNPELSTLAKVLVVVIPGLVQFVIGSVLQPKVMGSSLDLHPVAVLIALVFFGKIWGVVGMFLATPLTAVLKIVLEQTPYTKGFAGLLAGRLASIGGSGKPQTGSG